MFIRESIDLYHKQALDTGARIVHSCGFDSIPSDLTVFALYRRAESDQAGQLGDTNMVVRAMAGGVSGGTVASMIEFLRTVSADPEARRLLDDPYTLTPDRAAEPELGAQPDYSVATRPRDRAGIGRILGRGVRDGRAEHPNCSAQQRITGLRIRPPVRVCRTDEHGPLDRRACGCGTGDRG